MRIALISDIHGNDTALEAVLNDINRQAVDSLICLGDVATIGPQPRQVLARLRKSGCPCVMGNHDAALLRPDKALDYQVAPTLISSLEWCTQQLTQEDKATLQSFQPVVELSLSATDRLLCFHGSPQSNTDLILATTPGDELDRLLAGQTAVVLAGGHSHIQMLRQHLGKLIVNPGSVGNAFLRPPVPGTTPTLLPWGEYAIIHWTDGVLSVDLRRVPFDVTTFREIVSQSDIPIKTWWLQQYTTVSVNSEQ